MNWLRKWLDKQRALRDLRAHRNGYDWMAGELLRGAKTADELEDLHHACMWSKTPFDDGVIAALAKWRERKRPNYIAPLHRLELCISSYAAPADVKHAVNRALSELRDSLRGL
jgi:hypothetical protein